MPNARRPGTSLALLSSLALFAAGCQKPPTETRLPIPEVVVVAVDYDATLQKATVTPKIIRLKEGAQFVRWMSCDGDPKPLFDPKDMPFDHAPDPTAARAQAPAGGAMASAAAAGSQKHTKDSEKPKKGSARDKGYAYTVELVLPDGRTVPADPMIFVDP